MSLVPSSKSATANVMNTPRLSSKDKKSKLGRVQSDTQSGKKSSKSKLDETVVLNKSSNSKLKTDALNNIESSSNKSGVPAASSDLGGDNNYAFTRLDVPNGFLPPAFKDCLLSNVVRSGRRSLDHLKEVRESLSNLVAEDDQLSKGIRKTNPSQDILQLSLVAEALTVLTREAFIPTHRLNQTTIALYSAEDFLRYPKDIRSFDTIGVGRIKVPDLSFNAETVQKLRAVVDKATEYYNKFNLKGPNGAELQDIMFTLMRAFQDLYTLMLGCQEVFKVLLYTSPKERLNLQKFLLSLQSMERSDMLTEVQDLRRLTDELVIFLEKLSWGCFVVYRLTSGGKTVAPPNKDGGGTAEQSTATKLTKDDDHHLYPDFPLSRQIRGMNKIKGSKKKSSSKRMGVDEQKPRTENQNVGKGKKTSSKSKRNNFKSDASNEALYLAMRESLRLKSSKDKKAKVISKSKVKFLTKVEKST